MEKTWASEDYENKLLDSILDRVNLLLTINEAKKKDAAKYQELITKELLECYEDPVYFIENYCYTDKNPGFFSSRIQTSVPYLLFDYQVEVIDMLKYAVENGERVFIEKSRQMGMSWLVCVFALWGWLFRDWKILFLSQKENYVDKIGDMQSLFQKIRFMARQLPKWMLPPGFSIEMHMPRLRIFKPEGFGTGSITGESANSNAGTGGTYKFILMDEMAKMENANSINTAVQAATGCVIYNSTPLGKFNEYYRMRLLASEGKMIRIRLHWSVNPFYTKEWYLWKTKGMTPEQIAQEFEINYDASVSGRVYPRFAHRPAGDCYFGDIKYDPYLPLYCSVDNSHGGKDNHAIIFAQVTPNGVIRIIDSHQLPPFTTIEECASLLAKSPTGRIDDEAMKFLERIRDFKTPIYIGDPYDSKTTWNDSSISKIYRNYGLTLNLPDRKKGIEERIRICQLNMSRIEVNVDTESIYSLNWGLVSAIQNARYPDRAESAQSTTRNYTPIHDETSHFRTSFEYLINYIIEAEESMGIIGGRRQKDTEKRYVEKPNYITGENEYVLE